jgi:hypothetical protein
MNFKVGITLLLFILIGRMQVYGQQKALPYHIIYKTRKDYFNYVPVILSPDKKRITSYPDPEQLKNSGFGYHPFKLNDNYLEDIHGLLNEHVAFLGISLDDYVKLKELPSDSTLMSWIIDKDPLTFMCKCAPNAVHNPDEEVFNRWIARKQLAQKCKRIKLH